MLMMCRYC